MVNIINSFSQLTFVSIVLITKQLSCAFMNSAVGNPKKEFALHAKPKRLEANVDGVLYVNDRCINCAACSGFAPETFSRDGGKHIVYKQPETDGEVIKARAALAACPVAAIRVETLAERRHRAIDKASVEESWTEHDQELVNSMSLAPSKQQFTKPFPRPFLQDEMLSNADKSIPDVYWLGHHNEASFGAVPYLVKARHNNKDVWIMVDTPKYSKAAIRDVLDVVGDDNKPDYLFLTHVDDTADHGLWAEEFGLKQIFHSGDLGRHNWVGDRTLENVEVLLPKVNSDNQQTSSSGLTAYSLDGEVLDDSWQDKFESGSMDSNVVVIHTPGHSPGSITLYRRSTENSPGILFTGDTYAFTTAAGGRMTGFGRYGNNREQQVKTLSKLLKLSDWSIVAPGHGHSRDYRGESDEIKEKELQQAQNDLLTFAS